MINRIFVFIFCFISFASAQTPIERADRLFTDMAALPSVPGINVAVADENGLLWAKGFGYADIEHRVPMTPATKMRIGSVAKVITTAAMMKMVERGELSLDADIRVYVPEWPEKHPMITLRQLANHTSGIRHYEGNEFLSNVQYDNSLSALEIFSDSDLKFPPGRSYSYTTYGWTLVSAAMEAVSRKSFKDIIRDEVIIPLGLNDTTFDDANIMIENRQSAYDFLDGELKNSPEVNVSYKYAGGGFLATPADVVTFTMAHVNSGFLTQETLDQMFQRSNISPHGIGWVVGFQRYINNFSGNPATRDEMMRIMSEHPSAVMHSGGSTGALTMMILCLDHKHSVALTKNVGNGPDANHFELALRTLDIFHNDDE
ncbi:serine hydrolase domain-containing protein [Pseudemcibacter aquimaris]|uniref:serine hydrolase domain-containing protein n=1 Tax=Pseudemcibacter aquimaris TaxID=2857064 RepID=UPI00201227FF|nr:serine hydrolase domain-containing protein [Pseudemcibacter aquimaris]MCC3859612.1 beta-lactamase family protein [Pseudemcibacter aquimaris]WDU60007.1 beta-lactamase family protein [Pseudemcibacter aquimaris]